MVEPLFRFDGKPVAGSSITLDGPEGHHAASVRRMRVGESIQLTDGKDTHSRGVVVDVAQKSLEIRIDEVSAIPQAKLRFGLVQALAKGDRDELAVQAATELGCEVITPWQAERSISKWDESKRAKNQERWQSIASEAAKQALRPRFPVVNELQSSKQLASRMNKETFLVLDPTAQLSLAEWVAPQEGLVHLVVGPEGGITENELTNFAAAGAVRVHLGKGILRTSTAGMAAIAFLAGQNGLWV